MHLVIPKSFNDAQDVADKFKDSIPVIINLQGSETDLSKRLIDFASGLTYALDGGMQRIADKVFLLTPRNVEVSAEERARLIEKGFFNQSPEPRPHRTLSAAMQVGFIGAGNMARALARGWGEPVLCTDSGSGRAQALADELGGEAVGSNRELAERADLVVLAHKPAQLAEVAREIGRRARRRSSRSSRARRRPSVRAAYPARPSSGSSRTRRSRCAAACSRSPSPTRRCRRRAAQQVRELFGRLGTVVDVPERLMRSPARCSGVGPAYWALLVEAQVDAAVRRGMPAALAAHARHRDDGRLGRAAARARRRHARAAPRGRLARRHDRARARGARARRRARGARAARWTTWWASRDVFAAARNEIADFLSALITVYMIIIIAWVVVSFVFSHGRARARTRAGRTRCWTSCATSPSPYLRLFRRLPLRIGPLDLTPIVAIIALQIVGGDRRRR